MSIRRTAVDHVLLTRFNLPTQGVEGLVRARVGWLEERVELFETYCAPSVARQTESMTWLVYFDPDSPSWLLERLGPLVRQGVFIPVFRQSVTEQDLLSDIRASVVQRSETLLTSNLDNDDGLAHDFVARVQASAPHGRTAVLYVTRGLIMHTDAVYLRVDRRNAFCSVAAPWDKAVTAWSEYHNEFPQVMPAVEIDGPPAWLQVVHSANVSNRVRGRLVAPHRYSEQFGDLIRAAREPTAGEMLKDRLIEVPARSMRDNARGMIRVAGLRVLGKERYQAAKRWLSERVRDRTIA